MSAEDRMIAMGDYVFDWALVYLFSEWIIRLIMMIYVPQRRSTADARTWLLTIFIFPLGGLLLYSFLGRAYLSKRRQKLHERVSKLMRTVGKDFFRPYDTHPELAPQFTQAITLAEKLGDFPIQKGNHVELLAEYDATIDRLVEDINAAQHHVHLLYYIFANDQTGNKIVDALSAAAQRGVVCRVLIDSMGSKSWRRRLVPRLRTAGVDV